MMGQPCKKCRERYDLESMPHGLCEDCQAEFDALDLEDRLDWALDNK